MTNADDSEPLIINGRAVNRNLLEVRAMRPCRIEDCQSYCCSGGVWIHTRQADDIIAHAHLILPYLPKDRHDTSQWFDGTEEPDDDYPEAGPCTGTSVIEDPTHPAGTTCIFLRPDRKCALQVASIEAGEHPWRFKPFYCALHPLCLDEGELVLAEESEMYIEGGCCHQPDPDNFVPVYQLFAAETRLVLGDEGYAQLDALAKNGAR